MEIFSVSLRSGVGQLVLVHQKGAMGCVQPGTKTLESTEIQHVRRQEMARQRLALVQALRKGKMSASHSPFPMAGGQRPTLAGQGAELEQSLSHGSMTTAVIGVKNQQPGLDQRLLRSFP